MARFSPLFSLRLFFKKAIKPLGYKAPQALASCIVPSALGEIALNAAKESGICEIQSADAMLGLFLSFYNDSLLIDIDRCDIDGIAAILDSELLANHLVLPWLFGRTLYDKFDRLFPNRTSQLSWDETRTLLEDTPGGVFQLGDLIVGPFGLLRSAEPRQLPPQDRAPLWHCFDPACPALHSVRLSSGDVTCVTISQLIDIRDAANGPSSEWAAFYSHTLEPTDTWYDHQNPSSLPWLLGHCLLEEELRVLAEQLLSVKNSEVRTRLSASRRREGVAFGSAASIAAQLGIAELLQAILLARDEHIIAALERCIDAEMIYIPPTEIREVPFSAAERGWMDIVAQCAKRGVRFFSDDPSFGIRVLRAVVHKVYAEPSDRKDLNWKLRHTAGATTDERLTEFIYSVPLERAITELFMDSFTHLERAFAALKFGNFAVPDSPDSEREVVQRILWKLGFGTYSFPLQNQRFWSRLKGFESAALAVDQIGEEEKERLRSLGVNLFVSLEEILDASLSFVAWVLLSDHYKDTTFRYRPHDARRFMAEVLNNKQSEVTYDPQGKNTLFPLISGFQLLAQIASDMLEQPPGTYKRKPEEFPGYAQSAIEPFPFAHVMLVLDVWRSDVERMVEVLGAVTRDLSTAQVASVRNRIEHQRSDFPAAKEILDVCARLRSVVANLELSGIAPLLSVRGEQSMDEYGRGTMTFVRYDKSEISIRWPPLITRPLPPANAPQAIIPSLRMVGTSEPIRFWYQEESSFAKYWRGYPIKRRRVTSQTADCNVEVPPTQPANAGLTEEHDSRDPKGTETGA